MENEKLKKAIWESHFSLVRLAEESQVSLATLHRLKTGKSQKPQHETLLRVSRCLGKTTEELF